MFTEDLKEMLVGQLKHDAAIAQATRLATLHDVSRELRISLSREETLHTFGERFIRMMGLPSLKDVVSQVDAHGHSTV